MYSAKCERQREVSDGRVVRLKQRAKERLARLLVSVGWRLGLLNDRSLFPIYESLGLHITPNHFYQPIPDTRTLTAELFRRRSALAGVAVREEAQLQLLAQLEKFSGEYNALPREPVAGRFHLNNGFFESVDAEVLYALIRTLKPRRIYEIGSGFSTRLAAEACLKNEADGAPRCELIAFEPYPHEWLAAGFPGLTALERVPVQSIPVDRFAALAENDILFIDSSHVLKIGSDVHYEFLELLPRLRRGVVVHLHDIFLPLEYPRQWVMEEWRFWNEQYVLQAFLAFNDSFEVLWAGTYLALERPDDLARAFASFRPGITYPGSFWMRKVRETVPRASSAR